MFRLFVTAYAQKKETDPRWERFLCQHSYIGTFLCGIVIPLFVLVVVASLCYATMLPISLLMGWI